MKLSVAMIFFIGFACHVAAFPGASDPGVPHGGGSFGILTPSGSYKPGNT